MNADDEFYRYAIEKVEGRVCKLVDRFLNHRKLFEEAHDFESPGDDTLDVENGFYFIVGICIDIVAPEWSWKMDFDNLDNPDKRYGWVTKVPCRS